MVATVALVTAAALALRRD
ncbi:MAG: hypothetical protein ABEH40_09750 [Haloferacaceae archaeon]